MTSPWPLPEDALPEDPDAFPPKPRGVRADPRVLASIALGGMAGATARYELALAWPTQAGGFPWATFWTNLSGSFVLGLLVVVLVERFPSNRYARPFLGTGVLGAYTTFSTFSVETDLLLKDGHIGVAAGYVAASLVFGVMAGWLGIRVGLRVGGPVGRREVET